MKSMGGESREVVRAPNQFGADLFARLRGRPGNLLVSPWCLFTALAMAYEGSRGETAGQMATTLHLPEDWGERSAAMGNLVRGLGVEVEGERGVEIHAANALWCQAGYALLPGFLERVHQRYDGSLGEVDFQTAPGEACRRINEWAETNTRGRIAELIDGTQLHPLTRLLLTSAIFFKGGWSEPFVRDRTRERPFRIAPGREVPVSMVRNTESFSYMEEDDLQALELPYLGGRFEMVVLLPSATDGLEDLERKISPEQIERWG